MGIQSHSCTQLRKFKTLQYLHKRWIKIKIEFKIKSWNDLEYSLRAYVLHKSCKDLLHIQWYKRRMLCVFWLCIRHWYRRNESGMGLDIFHEYMQDGLDIQDLSYIQVLVLKQNNVHIYIRLHITFLHYIICLISIYIFIIQCILNAIRNIPFPFYDFRNMSFSPDSTYVAHN